MEKRAVVSAQDTPDPRHTLQKTAASDSRPAAAGEVLRELDQDITKDLSDAAQQIMRRSSR